MKVLRLLALIAALAVPMTAVHGQTYPGGPITIIVPWPPGASVDNAARILAAELSTQMNQSVLVENRPGASGSIGTAYALSAPPDGYTLLVANSSPLAQNVVHFPDITYDPRTDLEPISLIYDSVFAISVGNDVPVENFEEFIQYARDNPGQVTLANSGVATPMHLLGAIINRDAGIDMLHVPYQGGGPAVTDTIAGEVTAVIGTLPAVAAFHAEGHLKIIAVSTAERLPEYPDISTIDEILPGNVAGGWGAIVAPKGTPAEIIEILNAEVAEAVASENMQTALKAAGLVPESSSPEQVLETINNEINVLEEVLASGISLN